MAIGDAPVTPPFVLPDRLGMTCAYPAGNDWNNALDNGWYMASSGANAPAVDWFYGLVVAHNTAWVQQRLWRFTSYGQEYVRDKYSGTWQPWMPVMIGAQHGYIQTAGLANDSSFVHTITFPHTFRTTPMVQLTLAGWTIAPSNWHAAFNVTTTQFDIFGWNGPNTNQISYYWLATAV